MSGSYHFVCSYIPLEVVTKGGVIILSWCQWAIFSISNTGVWVVTANFIFPQSHFFVLFRDQSPIAVTPYLRFSGGKNRPCKIGASANQSAITPIATVNPNVRGFQLYASFVPSTAVAIRWSRHSVELLLQVVIIFTWRALYQSLKCRWLSPVEQFYIVCQSVRDRSSGNCFSIGL